MWNHILSSASEMSYLSFNKKSEYFSLLQYLIMPLILESYGGLYLILIPMIKPFNMSFPKPVYPVSYRCPICGLIFLSTCDIRFVFRDPATCVRMSIACIISLPRKLYIVNILCIRLVITFTIYVHTGINPRDFCSLYINSNHKM